MPRASIAKIFPASIRQSPSPSNGQSLSLSSRLAASDSFSLSHVYLAPSIGPFDPSPSMLVSLG